MQQDLRTAPAGLYERPHWYACFTRARHEKRVDQALGRRGFDTYLPLVARERQWKDRKKVVEFPLFPSYVFLRMTLDAVHTVITAPGVSTLVRARGYPAPIRDAELQNVRRFVASLEDAGMEPHSVPFFTEGQWVRVKDGPFKGVVGVVRERRGRCRVLVGLGAIRHGFAVDVEARSLEPISHGRAPHMPRHELRRPLGTSA